LGTATVALCGDGTEVNARTLCEASLRMPVEDDRDVRLLVPEPVLGGAPRESLLFFVGRLGVYEPER
jgi:hypothetical protein